MQYLKSWLVAPWVLFVWPALELAVLLLMFPVNLLVMLFNADRTE